VKRIQRWCCAWAALLYAGIGAAQGLADEERDYGVPPQSIVRAEKYHGPTPRTIPGARTVTTAELKAMLDNGPRPFLVDVLSGPAHRTLPGAIWMHNGGLGDFDNAEEKRFLDTIALFVGLDKTRPIAFFCSGVQCWLSYNAALRAAQAGYTNVLWYRGGIDAWRLAGFATTRSDPFPW